MHHFLPYVPLLILLAWAAQEDLRSRRIRNWLTLVLIITGFTQSLTAGALVSWTQSLQGIAAGIGLTFILFAIGALGGGDVKLMMGVGAWVGPLGVCQVFAIAAIVGMCIVLAQCAWNGRLRTLFRNAATVLLNLKHWDLVGMEHIQQTGLSCRSVDKPLPYAVPVLIAVLMTVVHAGLY